MRLTYHSDEGPSATAGFGLIVLQEDETIEAELPHWLSGPGQATYVTRIAMAPEIRPDTLISMLSDLPRAADLLPEAARLAVVGFGCTSAATVIGSAAVADAITSVRPECRVTDPLAAFIAAGRALGVTRIGYLSPYISEVSAPMRYALEDAGFEIAALASFEQADDRRVARISPASIRTGIEAVARAATCEAVFVSCTNLRAGGILATCEGGLGVPVVSSNLALAWHMRRLAGLSGAPISTRLFDLEHQRGILT